MSGTRLRLDEALVERGLAQSRARARDLIRRGLVRIGASPAVKPAQLVAADAMLAIDTRAADFVSRGAEKLIAALDAFRFDPDGRVAVDVGASTGGFTQVLLERGARRVHAVDVGHGQLAARLAADPRVVTHEGLDARRLEYAHVGEPVGALVADVSFISLTLALPAALGLAAPGAWLVALIKPQFEAGREAVGRGGVVRDAAAREAALQRVRSWLDAEPGWRVVGTMSSPITGQSGNVEHLIGAVHD